MNWAIGQRWRHYDLKKSNYRVIAIESDGRARVTWEGPNGREAVQSTTEKFDATGEHWTFLGYAPGYGPSSPPEAKEEGVRVGQRRQWHNFKGAKDCGPFVVTVGGVGFCAVFESGNGQSANFEEAYFEEHSTLLPATPVTSGVPVEAPLPVVDPRFTGEKRDIGTGAALSCLQLIQARKPPEPWRPTVDEFDLLPDAYGVTR